MDREGIPVHSVRDFVLLQILGIESVIPFSPRAHLCCGCDK